jgi:RNA polymerase sigma-70 factor (ECF subfamily)
MIDNTHSPVRARPYTQSLIERVAGGMPPAEPPAPDAGLMQRVTEHDGEALAELYDLYAPNVFSLCLRFLKEPPLAEDALQEVFLRVWQRAGLYQPARGTAIAWLMGITRNTCIDQLRRIQTRPQAAELPADPDAPLLEETLADPAGDVPALADASERASLVRRALAGLAPEQQLVIELSFFKGLSRREIARRLDLPEGTVHTRARLALHNLRGRLDNLGT